MRHPSALPLRRLGVTGGGFANRSAAGGWRPADEAITLCWVIDPGWRLDGTELDHPWLWILPPGTGSRTVAIPAGCRLLWFQLAPLERWDALCRLGIHHRHPGGRDRHDTTLQLVSRWAAETAAPWLLAERIAHSLGDALAAIIERRLHEVSAPGPRQRTGGLDAVWQRVHDDPVGPWPLARLARMAGCSPSHLHRLCLLGSGLPPVRIVADIRLRRAALLLGEGTRSVDAVAALVGYSSGAALSKAYHRRFGVRPGRTRASVADPPFR